MSVPKLRQIRIANPGPVLQPDLNSNNKQLIRTVKSQQDDYWAGPFFLPGPNLNPRLSSLVIAIIDLASCINTQTRPAMPLEMAAAYLMPETFSTIIKLFNLENPE